MAVYDCFPFFNELDLLEIRLNELNDVVDYFVLTEAEQTWQNSKKPLYYSEALNEARFLKFKSKIIHKVAPGGNFVGDSWANEKFQWTLSIQNGLDIAEDDDLIISGAIDEIPNSDSFLLFKNRIEDGTGIFRFRQRNYYYYLNTVFDDKSSSRNDATWYGTCAAKKKQLMVDPYGLSITGRRGADRLPNIIPNGGWHFSYMGDAANAITKLNSAAHTEFNHLTLNDMQHFFRNLKDPCARSGNDEAKFLGHDRIENLPNYVQNNLDQYGKYLHQSQQSGTNNQ